MCDECGFLAVAPRDCDAEYVTVYLRRTMHNFFPCLKSRALHPESSVGTCGPADDSGRIVGKIESKELEFQKEDLTLVGAEPTSIMPNDM
jgi:hypothetical protein